MIGFNSLKKRVAAWRKNEDGSVAVESVLMLPLMVWATLSTLNYFDAYRQEGINNKAALTLADMISREADFITPDYMNGAHGLLSFLVEDVASPDLRITAIRWDENQNKYRKVWSKRKGTKPPLSTSDLIGLHDRLPLLTDGEVVIMVETWSSYQAPFKFGLEPFTFETYNVIKPRFVPQLCWNATPNDPNAAKC